MGTSRKILIFGDDTRSFLATVRSLGRAGLLVHAAPFDFQAPALKSRYVSRIHWLPQYLGEGQEWLQAVEALLKTERFDLVIPCDERALLPLDKHREQLGTLAQLAIPDARSLEFFFNKDRTRELARVLGVPVAVGRLIATGDTAQTLIAEVGLPVAIKPCWSYTVDRLYARNRVIIAADELALTQALASSRGIPHYFEAFFDGIGCGLSVLANQGRVLQAFQHRRVHELHGSSYYRVSEELSPFLMDAVAKMIDAARYTGVAMFEFKVNHETANWILLEVNARPWGSLPLPVALGVDFPTLWYQLLVEGVEAPPFPYQAGIYGRNLMPDARHVASLAGALRRRPLEFARYVLAALGEYVRVLTGREVQDVFVADDRGPSWCELKNYLRDVARYHGSKIPGAADLASRRDRRLLRRAIRRESSGCSDIMFVCQGNICRSPLAAALLRREFRRESNSIRVRSYGNLPRRGAISPTNAVAAAKPFGVDLRPHRSRHFAHAAAERASVVVVFDDINRLWIEKRYPVLAAPIVMLGSFSPHRGSRRAIADPDGGDLARFESIYSEIADAIAGLAKEIRRSRNA